ncbi:coiled-coil domain-containing protein 149 [Ostrinia nubilalis]|uniref:coiled-coil domain-containing protein 149 n=1 Tax=Ostrinia nubilalis TaxID=29057 RepID=UPI0030826B5D
MFTKNHNNKVKFQDQQLDDYVLENSVLKSKLQSKIDALLIMSRELDKCSMERDRYKVLVEQFKCKKPVLHSQDSNYSKYKFTPTNTISGGDMLAKTRDHNNMLKLEVETLRSKLEEATGDIVALRKELQKKEYYFEDNHDTKKSSNLTYSNQDYELLVQELEKIQKKYQQLQLDYRATLDEKEELVSDRDYYKNKVQRLNQQISYILSNRVKGQIADKELDPPKPIVDIDALVTENKYLHERITQLQVEKEIIKRTLTKYKTLLDNRNKNDSLNFKKGFADVMTQKQVREFLDINSKTGLKRSSAAELKSLCLGLFEALNDKSIALQHQRKTNQILANRITELEKTLESWCNGQKYIPIFPSQMLLEEFFPDTGSVKSNETKEKNSNDSSENIKNKYSDSDEELNKEHSDGDDSLRGYKNNYDDGSEVQADRNISKTVLPQELEELVKEALAELKPVG